jgi:hypothetical protein
MRRLGGTQRDRNALKPSLGSEENERNAEEDERKRTLDHKTTVSG